MELNSKSLKKWAARLKSETYALYIAYKDPRVPWYAKVVAVVVVGLAFSPIDLIPDFIPVLGYLDDAIVVPLGVMLVMRMIPKEVLSESRTQAQEMISRGETPVTKAAAAVIVCMWIALAVLAVILAVRFFWA